MSVIEEKKALRTYIRQTERTLDPAYKAESSEAICRCVLALEEYRAAGTVFAFAGTVHEIDTSLLLKETLAAGKTLVLPRCAEGHTLDLCVVTNVPRWKFPIIIPFALKGKHGGFKGVDQYRASRIEIRTSTPCWVQTDGEIPGKLDRIELTVEKQKLRFII